MYQRIVESEESEPNSAFTLESLESNGEFSLSSQDDMLHDRNVDPNMNDYKIVFMHNRPRKIRDMPESKVLQKNAFS